MTSHKSEAGAVLRDRETATKEQAEASLTAPCPPHDFGTEMYPEVQVYWLRQGVPWLICRRCDVKVATDLLDFNTELNGDRS